MSEKTSAKLQEFRPADLKRIIAQVPAEAIVGMARDTVEDKLHLGTKAANRAGREKQITDAEKTIRAVERKKK